MAISYTQSESGDFSATPLSFTLAAGLTLGSLIVAACGWDNITRTCTVSDNTGGSWVALGSPQTGAGGLATYRFQFFYAANHPAGATNFTATLSGSGNVGMAVHEFQGLGASPLDAGPLYSNVNSATPSTSSLSTVANDALLFSAALVTSGYTAGPDSPWVLDQLAHFGGNPTGHRIVSAQGNYTATYHVDAADNILGIVSFNAGSQVILPDADIAAGGWGTAPLFSKWNDASDATIGTATAS